MECLFCGRLASSSLKVCGECIKAEPEKTRIYIEQAHAESRRAFGLPPEAPALGDVACNLCVNKCHLRENELSLCGMKKAEKGRLVHLPGNKAVASFYYDPLPTNCVASFTCDGSKEKGYNLAVFYGACSFDCLFCQNWEYRYNTAKLEPLISPEELASRVTPEVKCICYFGGDPTPQILHTIETNRLVGDRVRICYETNGSMNLSVLKTIAKQSFSSGGCIKFDLKAWDENLHIALTGASNKNTLRNFEYLAENFQRREGMPFLIASTLIIPGYISAEEVERIAEFISSLNPEIPYSLLAFYPEYRFKDLPTTSWKLALECLRVAKKHLQKVHLGNVHLLR